jgi:hypothetical protein
MYTHERNAATAILGIKERLAVSRAEISALLPGDSAPRRKLRQQLGDMLEELSGRRPPTRQPIEATSSPALPVRLQLRVQGEPE